MFHPQILAANIKLHRKAAGLSQNMLARALNVSPQSVSKWETGVSAPDIENLCLLSDILRVPVDILLAQSSERQKVMIGIDGGGSKTEFILFTEDGRILDRLLAGPCNPNIIGIDACIELLTRQIDLLASAAPGLCGIHVGSAGFLLGSNTPRIRSALKKQYPQLKISCATDILNVTASATEAESCIAAICGTGSVVFAKEGDRLTRLGGWGYLLSRAGSGYDIGRDGLCAALAEMDGFGPHTRITDLVRARIGGGSSDVIEQVCKNDPSYAASFAETVFAAFRDGDSVAGRILNDNTAALAEIINHAARQYKCENRVVLSGGIATGNSEFIGILRPHLVPGLEILIPDCPQVLGACLLCAKACGVETEGLLEKLSVKYGEMRSKC